MEKKNTGSIAIPFLVTLLISLVITGCAALYVYRLITKDDSSLLTMTGSITQITEEDEFTILCILDTGEQDVPRSYMLYHFNPMIKKTCCIGLPANLLLTLDGQTATVDSNYLTGGVPTLKKAVEATMEITVDRYMKFNTESFDKLCSVLGGVEASVPVRIKGIPNTTITQYLNSEQIRLFIGYTGFSGEELQRATIVSSTMSSMLNQTDPVRINAVLESTYNTLVDMMDTDVSALDFKNRKNAMSYMLEYAPQSCFYLVPVCVKNADTYELEPGFLTTIQEKF